MDNQSRNSSQRQTSCTSRILAALICLAVTGASRGQTTAAAPLPEFPQLPPPPYVTPDMPQGSGPHPAIMEADPGLVTHTVYRPKDLGALGKEKLPIVVFGNGGCRNIGNRFRYFLTEIASHGYLAIAIGPVGAAQAEFDTTYNQQLPAPGSPAAALLAEGKSLAAAPGSRVTSAFTTPAQLIEAIDWAQAENRRPNSIYFGMLDADQIAVMGQSCGGLQAIEAAHDPRVKTLGVWNSGAFTNDATSFATAAARVPKSSLKTLHAPTIYVTGAPSDIAFANAEDDAANSAAKEKIDEIVVTGTQIRGVKAVGTKALTIDHDAPTNRLAAPALARPGAHYNAHSQRPSLIDWGQPS